MTQLPSDQLGTIREDGGYVGKCTGCYRHYWNYWGAGTYCASCLHGYCQALKDRWDDAEIRAEAATDALKDLVAWVDGWRDTVDGELEACWLVRFKEATPELMAARAALDEEQR